ncbi:MAG: hypothetical protein MZU97_20100 [Bacillus subtilis]|nr:hypothetical protein [Bacillus subtilis]
MGSLPSKRIRPIFRAIAKYSGLTWVSKQYAKIPHKFKDWLYGYLFILPWILGMGLIGLPVLGRSIRMALSDKYFFVAGQGWRITGLWSDFTQFKRIFTSEPWHLQQIVNTTQDIALVVPLVVIFALILAMMLNQKVKGRARLSDNLLHSRHLALGKHAFEFSIQRTLDGPGDRIGNDQRNPHQLLSGSLQRSNVARVSKDRVDLVAVGRADFDLPRRTSEDGQTNVRGRRNRRRVDVGSFLENHLAGVVAADVHQYHLHDHHLRELVEQPDRDDHRVPFARTRVAHGNLVRRDQLWPRVFGGAFVGLVRHPVVRSSAVIRAS